MELAELKEWAERLQVMAANKQDSFAAALVIPRIIEPLLRLVAAGQQGRWLTINEAIAERARLTGKPSGKNWFEKPLARYDGQSRLEVWKKHDLADLTDGGSGVWLISPLVLVEDMPVQAPTSEASGHDLPPSNEPSDPDVESDVDELLS